MKIKLSTRKPRNPFVAASMQRAAGPHGRAGASAKARHAARRLIRHELQAALQGAQRREHEPHSP